MKKYILLFILLSSCASKTNVETSAAPEVKKSKSSKVAVVSSEPKSSQEMLKSKVVEPIIEKEPVKADENQTDTLKRAVQELNDEAIIKAASQILYQSPNDVVALNNSAMAHYRKKQYDAAAFLLNKALGLQPDRSELHSNLGLIQIAQNERRFGILSFKKALELNEYNAVANVNLGTIYVAEKDFAKALIVLEKAYNAGIRDVKFLNNYGIALTANAKYDKALDVYKLATKDSNSQRDILFNMAIVMIDHLGKYKDGMEVINRLRFVGGSEYKAKLNLLEEKAKQEMK